MNSFFCIFRMDMKNLVKNPVLLGYNTVFIFLLVFIMGFLTSGSYGNDKDAYQYYMISFLIYSMLNGAMTASNSFMERDIRQANLRIIHSPAGNFQVYFSKLVASFLFDYLLHVFFVVTFCGIFQLTLGENPLYFLVLMIPVEFASAALGIFFCCLLHTEEATSSLLSTVISLLAVIGGTFFSLEGWGSTMAFISRLSPVKWLNDAFFEIAIDNNLSLFWYVLVGGIVCSIALVVGCKFLFKTEDYI